MPILDLLGDRFDMQLLGKLTLSVAAVLFISWVFRFYSSRAQNRKQGNKIISLPRGAQTKSETCNNRKMEFQQEKTTANKETDGENQSTLSVDFTQECLNLEETNEIRKREPSNTKILVTNTVESVSPAGQHNMKYSTLVKAKGEMKDCKTELTLLTPDLGDKATGILTGRRSPCLLRKIDGGVEVGRELRQNLGHSGTFSSFQSKAEIKMENADLLMEGPGDQTIGVRGKIYDYYVETSSQSVSELSTAHSLSTTFGPFESSTLFDTQSMSLPGVMDTSQIASPQPSSLIIRDLEFAHKSGRVHQDQIESEQIKRRRVLLRKDSYLAAAEDSELEVPFPLPVNAATHNKSVEPSNMVASGSEPHKQIHDLRWDPSEEPKVEVVAKAKFLCFPVDNPKSSDLEKLTSKLDLGNCLEALMLAKKHGHSALQQAALRVMSDNYFQVLQDPALYGRLKAGERDQIQRLRRKGKRCLMVADMETPEWARYPSHYLGSKDVRASSGLYYYDDYNDSWHLQCQIPQEVISKGCAMCTMDNYLFVAVGFQKTLPSRKVFCYNPMTSIWSEICSMNEARPHCKLVALQDHVYAIGGECLSTVERYDARTDRWTYVAPLPNETFAVAHRATACNGEIFVSGGTLKYTLLRYSPKTNTWRQSLIVGNKERTTEMVSVRNFLYRFDVNPNMGISVYRYHAVARLWYECCSKQMSHCPAFQCVAMDDVIYCVCQEFTMRFLADEVSPGFVAEDLKVPSESKGMLFPFVLTLPDKTTLQTTV